MAIAVDPGSRDLTAALRTEPRDAERALALEADAERYPDEAGELLLEAAHAWRQAGEPQRAIALLTELAAAGDEDGQFARVMLAEAYFDLGRDDDGHAELTALESMPPTSPGPCEVAAELLEERGDLVRAAEWYDVAASLLTEDELAALDGEFGWACYAAHVLLGRSRVRGFLGVPPDALDDAVRRARRWAPVGRFPSADELLASDPEGTLPAHEVRTLFWQRAEFAATRERWPALFDDNGPDPVAYHRRLEDRLKQLSRRGVARITLVPGTAEGLGRFAARTGGDPAEKATRYSYLCEQVDAGHTISWPPPRNARCWCGSESKYKKCCGSAST